MNRVRRGEMPGRSALRALIFDLDGTIADTEAVSYTHLTLPTTPYV